jgi:hypothetical protein
MRIEEYGGRLTRACRSLTDVLSGQDSSKPTTYVALRFAGAVHSSSLSLSSPSSSSPSAPQSDLAPKTSSKIVKRSDTPNYDEWLHVPIRDARCTVHLEVMEKHSFRELVLGCADINLASLRQAQASEMEVELERPEGEMPVGVVGRLKCRFVFDFRPTLLT